MEIHEKAAGPFDCCFAAKVVDDDPCRDLAEKFATLLDLIENEVDDAMMLIPRDGTAAREVRSHDATAPNEAQTIDHRPAA
jgi:hypothetical protein